MEEALCLCGSLACVDENGEPLGARWYDLWMTPNGEVVRKGRLLSADELATEARDNTNPP